MVATAHPAASGVAFKVLSEGGNAFDAAIAAAAVLVVVEPQSSGLGGDSFVLGHAAADQSTIAINGSGRSGRSASADELRRRGLTDMPMRGASSVTCPGAVDAWWKLHRKHGASEWGSLFEPAIRLARNGYPICDRVWLDWHTFESVLAAEAEAAAIFLPHGRAPAPGELHRQERLAETLSTLAARGREGFYDGWVAEDIVDTLRVRGACITRADLHDTTADDVEPLSIHYKGYDVLQMPANNQGPTALLLLNILKRFEFSDALASDRYHVLLEASRLAYRERDRHLGDPDGWGGADRRFVDDRLAGELAGMIDLARTQKMFPEPSSRKGDTTTISVVDEAGNAVTLINSLYYHFGSGVVAPVSGVTLQNRGSGFNLVPGHPNEFGPAKRPLHTIMPGLVLKEGRPAMVYGVMGGDYQAIGHAHLVTSIVDHGLDIQASIDLPRAFYFKGFAEIERSMPHGVTADLLRRGHSVQVANLPIGGAQAIWIDPGTGTLSAGSDPRKDGLAIGL